MIDLKSQRSTRRWSAFSPGVKAGICVGAVVGTVILTIAGYFIVLAIIRRRRKKIGESTASAGGRGVPVGELGANEEAEGEKRHWYARRWGKRRSLLEIVTRRNKPTRPAELEVPEKKSDPSPHSSLSTPLAYRFHGGIAEVAGSTVTVELANTPVAELSVEDVKRQS